MDDLLCTRCGAVFHPATEHRCRVLGPRGFAHAFLDAVQPCGVNLSADGSARHTRPCDLLTAMVAAQVEQARATPQTPAACRACGATLLPVNRPVADGCPCNSPRGINHGLVETVVCTCKACDPDQTGSSRYRAAVPAQTPVVDPGVCPTCGGAKQVPRWIPGGGQRTVPCPACVGKGGGDREPGRELSRKVVAAVLENTTWPFESSLHGFELTRLEGDTLAPWRLVHGGGISGNGDRVWWLERKNGQDKSSLCRTRVSLVDVIARWIGAATGGHPDARPRASTGRAVRPARTARQVAHAIQDRYLSTPNFGHSDLLRIAEEEVEADRAHLETPGGAEVVALIRALEHSNTLDLRASKAYAALVKWRAKREPGSTGK